jgi:hypothetical protein
MANSQNLNEHFNFHDDGELQVGIFCLVCGNINPSDVSVCSVCHAALAQQQERQPTLYNEQIAVKKPGQGQNAGASRPSLWSTVSAIALICAFSISAVLIYGRNVTINEEMPTNQPLYGLGKHPTLSVLRDGNSNSTVHVNSQPGSFDWDSSLRFYLSPGWSPSINNSRPVSTTVIKATRLLVSETILNNADMDCFKRLLKNEPRIVMNSSTTGSHIAVMGLESQTLCRLTDPPQHKQDSDPVWLPDGRVAFQSNRDNLLDSAIYIVSADGATIQRMQMMPSMKFKIPRWSPDGNQIAFVSDYPDGRYLNLYVANADGTSLRRLTENTDIRSITWAPDSKTLAYSTGGGFGNYTAAYGECSTFIVAVDGSKSFSLPVLGECSDFLTWSPDGKSIALIAGLHGHSRLYITDANGTQGKAILEDHSQALERIAWDTVNWSPDGMSIIFRGAAQEGSWLTYIIQRDGRGLRVFYQGSESIYQLMLSTNSNFAQ